MSYYTSILLLAIVLSLGKSAPVSSKDQLYNPYNYKEFLNKLNQLPKQQSLSYYYTYPHYQEALDALKELAQLQMEDSTAQYYNYYSSQYLKMLKKLNQPHMESINWIYNDATGKGDSDAKGQETEKVAIQKAKAHKQWN